MRRDNTTQKKRGLWQPLRRFCPWNVLVFGFVLVPDCLKTEGGSKIGLARSTPRGSSFFLTETGRDVVVGLALRHTEGRNTRPTLTIGFKMLFHNFKLAEHVL
jgi:hypothetical protein